MSLMEVPKIKRGEEKQVANYSSCCDVIKLIDSSR